MKRSTRASRAGISLLEIIVAVSVFALLAGVIRVRSGSAVDASRALKASELVSTLKLACASFQADTGTLPYEYAGYSATSRLLSGTQILSGWNGPYIDSPFGTSGPSPYGSTLQLYNTTAANGWISGFDLDGDGSDDISGPANMLYFANVPEVEAKLLNDLLDSGVGGTWQNSGRVRYSASGTRMLVLVYR